jgi:hypothetical protein
VTVIRALLGALVRVHNALSPVLIKRLRLLFDGQVTAR